MLDAVCTLEDHEVASEGMMHATAKINIILDIKTDIIISVARTDSPFFIVVSASPFASELDHRQALELIYYIYADWCKAPSLWKMASLSPCRDETQSITVSEHHISKLFSF
ncbi:MAG TPA: hypothetical protein PKL29_08505 [Methanothrix sp.]|nr:hypothetical protein [Methanothrix sp.]